MFKKMIGVLAVAVCLSAPAVAQAQESNLPKYLDVTVVRVKWDKMSAFNALGKKIVDANRRFQGDHWVALETVYGDGSEFRFVSERQDYADIDKGNAAFLAALNKAYGKVGAQKIFDDLNDCTAGVHTELRALRWDLSTKPPSDAAGLGRLVGGAQVVRTIGLRLRPGYDDDFEAMAKQIKEAAEKNPNAQPVVVSEAVEGYGPTSYYVTMFSSSLAGLSQGPMLPEILGEEGMKKFTQMEKDSFEGARSEIYHFSPELSNPPDAMVAAAPDFWHPKMEAAPAAKPKAPAAKKPKS
jgi:hypothetical protein